MLLAVIADPARFAREHDAGAASSAASSGAPSAIEQPPSATAYATSSDQVRQRTAVREKERGGDDSVFEATDEWQEVRKGQHITKGLEVRLNMSTGERWARKLQPEADGADEKERSIVAVPQ